MYSLKFQIKILATLILIVSVLSQLSVQQTFGTIEERSLFKADDEITLSAYSYHNVTVHVEEGQAISGDWEVTPADVLSSPFLVFIVDSTSFRNWVESDNLTQAVDRIPGENLLYLYDPLLMLDDIPFDNRRSGTFQVKVPYTDNWSLVMYAGASITPLTFTWHIDVFAGIWLDVVVYGLISIIGLMVFIIVIVLYVKRKKVPEEDEVERLLKERDKLIQEELPERALGSLEDLGEEEAHQYDEFNA
ncbi:MAG: hypothetical protein ACTSPM_00530 [Candidatus Heimdallarchaeota archaeon]